jgi:hypothetical protein
MTTSIQELNKAKLTSALITIRVPFILRADLFMRSAERNLNLSQFCGLILEQVKTPEGADAVLDGKHLIKTTQDTTDDKKHIEEIARLKGQIKSIEKEKAELIKRLAMANEFAKQNSGAFWTEVKQF